MDNFKVKSSKVITINLELSLKGAEWLKSYMQNPIITEQGDTKIFFTDKAQLEKINAKNY